VEGHSVEIDDVAELQTGQLGVGDRRGQPHFVHPDVGQPLDGRVRHSIPSRG
jgi:hypothetical protein